MTPLSARWARAIAVWVGCGLGAWALGAALQPELHTLVARGFATPPADLLAASSAGVLVGCAAWLWIVVTAHLVGSARGCPTRWLGAPRWLRQLVVVACGVLVVGVPGLAQAAPAPDTPGSPDGPSLQGLSLPDLPDTETPYADPTKGAPLESGGPAPTEQEATGGPTGNSTSGTAVVSPDPEDAPAARPTPTPRPPADTEADPADSSHPEPTPASPTRPGSTVVVAPEDTLWSIAGAHCPPGASDATIDRTWREIWRANRDVIGDDPHLIRPGQRLVVQEPQ